MGAHQRFDPESRGRGQSLTEYVILVSLVAIAGIGAVSTLGPALDRLLSRAVARLDEVGSKIDRAGRGGRGGGGMSSSGGTGGASHGLLGDVDDGADEPSSRPNPRRGR